MANLSGVVLSALTILLSFNFSSGWILSNRSSKIHEILKSYEPVTAENYKKTLDHLSKLTDIAAITSNISNFKNSCREAEVCLEKECTVIQ
jgi:hypothetical protein